MSFETRSRGGLQLYSRSRELTYCILFAVHSSPPTISPWDPVFPSRRYVREPFSRNISSGGTDLNIRGTRIPSRRLPIRVITNYAEANIDRRGVSNGPRCRWRISASRDASRCTRLWYTAAGWWQPTCIIRSADSVLVNVRRIKLTLSAAHSYYRKQTSRERGIPPCARRGRCSW